jgi:alpha-mannosidase
MKTTLLFLLLFLFSNCILGQQLKVYIANDDHDDLMWAGTESDYIRVWVDMLDYYLNLADTYKDEPTQYQSRFSADGTLWLYYYKQKKSSADFNRLIGRIKDGHINVPKRPTVLTYGGMSAEAVFRSMYYAGELERQYNIQFPIVNSQEDQTLPFGVASLFAGAGCKYSWKGVCNCFTFVPGLDNAQRANEIYWWKGLDDQKILLKWYSLTSHNPPGGGSYQTIGGYAEAWNPSDAVDYVSSNSTFKARYPFNIIGVFGYGWDNLESKTDQFITVAKAKTNSTRQVIVSNQIDFFQDFETTYGANLASYNASFGNEWELDEECLAEESANVKRTVEKMRMAEALASYASIINPSFMNQYDSLKRKAFLDLGTYYDHAKVIHNNITSASLATFYKEKAASYTGYINNLLDKAATVVSAEIKKTGTNKRFFVFNPLSWERTDYVDFPYTNANVHVMDIGTNTEVPSQLVTVDGQQYMRILASNVPSVGYKVYEIVSGVGGSFPTTAVVSNSGGNSIVETDFYKITIAPRGAIISLIDKTRNNTEFANSVGGTYLNDLGSSTGALSVENNGPVSVTILATASSPLSHQTRITLYKSVNRIDIKNEITQNFNGLYSWGFGFNLTQPKLWHEEVGAILKADLLANGGHYSPKFARYDWFSLNHFADISGNTNMGITVSSPDCNYFKYGNSTNSTFDVSTPKISILAGYANQYGMINQGGDTHFLQRFSIIPHDTYSPVSAMKCSMEHQNTFYAKEITGGQTFPEKSFSLISITDPNVFLWALKPAEDGFNNAGLLARAWNLNSSSTNFNISSATAVILSGKETTHVESPISDATVSSGQLVCSANKNQIKSYTFKFNLNPSQTIPASPSTLTAEAVSISQINLSWTDNSNNEYGFKIESSSDGVNFTQITSVGPNIKTYSNTGLANAKTYYYRVRSYNDAGNSSYSNIANATTKSTVAAPSNLGANSISNVQINLTWTDNSNNESGFKIESGIDGVNFSQIATVGPNILTYSNTGLTSSKTYYYRVRSYNVDGNSTYSNTAQATTKSTTVAPSNLIANSISQTQINLSWTDNSNNESGFKIESGIDGVNFTQVAAVGSNIITYSNTGLTSAKTYYYRVRSYNADGNSIYSNIAQATTSSNPSTSIQNEHGDSILMVPNPAEDQIEIHNLTGIGEINIYTISGSIVKTVKYSGTSILINLSDMKAGMYIVNVVSGNKIYFTKRLVVQ